LTALAFSLKARPNTAIPDAIAAAAAASLLDELETWPKPGLVSHIDSGSHNDMNADTFRRSVAAIKPFYGVLAAAGAAGAEMAELRRVGLEAERAMLDTTGGVNTHRGAIFGLGLLCAATGAAWSAQDFPPSAPVLSAIVRRRWACAIVTGPIPIISHGTTALRLGRRLVPGDEGAARVQAAFALLAVVEDTNLLHRGGAAGLHYVQAEASAFLAQGGVGQTGWLEKALSVHRSLVRRRLSPGGCADLLALALFVDRVEAGL
jgi:triphosphoribosyl-dephospho-CoA synthase